MTYLLSKVFGGSFVDMVELGKNSLWDMLLAFIFRRLLLDAWSVGIFKQFRTLHHNDTRIRGRIDVDRHLRQNVPFCGNVAYATHEMTFDNPTNHIIRYALAKVTRKWGGIMTGDNRLLELRHQLERNTPTWQSGNVQSCIRRKENRTPIKHPFFHAAYEPLRLISLAILREEGAGLYQQHQEAEGVIFDGSWLWEEYIWTLLKKIEGFKHPENKNRDGGWRTPPGVTYYPDFYHQEKRIVLDAKYQTDTNDRIQENAKQVFCYMFLLDALHGGLIKPDRAPKAQESKICRQHPKAEQAFWHNIALPPQQASTPEEFVSNMKCLEDTFIKDTHRLLGLII